MLAWLHIQCHNNAARHTVLYKSPSACGVLWRRSALWSASQTQTAMGSPCRGGSGDLDSDALFSNGTCSCMCPERSSATLAFAV